MDKSVFCFLKGDLYVTINSAISVLLIPTGEQKHEGNTKQHIRKNELICLKFIENDWENIYISY